MNGDEGQASVARLLQSFDQQRAIARRREDMGVEVVALDAFRVGSG
jgi:hypothetical protein